MTDLEQLNAAIMAEAEQRFRADLLDERCKYLKEKLDAVAALAASGCSHDELGWRLRQFIASEFAKLVGMTPQTPETP